MTRIYGVVRNSHEEELCDKNKMSDKVFFTKYPILHKILLDHLAESTSTNGSCEVTQSVLIILERLHMHSDISDNQVIDLIVLLTYLKSFYTLP